MAPASKKMPLGSLLKKVVEGHFFLSRQAIRSKHAQKPLWCFEVAWGFGLAAFVRAFRCYPWRGITQLVPFLCKKTHNWH